MRPALRLAGGVALAGIIAACAMGPDYERPEIPVPLGWRDSALALRDSSYANVPWWEVFGDTTLQGMIRLGLRENQDVELALARVNEARALLGIQRLEFLPQIDVRAGVTRGSFPDSLGGEALPERTLMAVGVSVGWEIDLWGRLRRLNESARASLLASEFGRRGAILTVVSEIGRAYLELLDLDGQVQIALTQVDLRRQSLALATARFQGGLTSELDVRQGEVALAGAERTLASLYRLRSQKENELRLLTGQPPGDVPRGLPLMGQNFPAVVPAGLPSDLLQRRPDVRQSEEELHAANARIGAAIADLFPRLSLTGSAGTASRELGDLFSTGTGFWTIGANLLGPIINRGRNLKQVAAERARTEAAIAGYEKTVLGAFREVEDGLVAVQWFREEAAAAGRAVAASTRAYELARLRYEGGVDDYLTLLDAQREMLDAQLLESELQRQSRVAVVRLYKALGGGWDPVTDTLAMPLPEEPPPR